MEEDKLFYYSKSANKQAGKGVNEFVSNYNDYNELNKIKDWRKMLSNFYVAEFTYNGKTYSTNNFSAANFYFDRVMDKNVFYKNNIKNVRGDAYTMSPYHVLWPIPRNAILANSLNQLNQNIGYAGSEKNKPALDKIPE